MPSLDKTPQQIIAIGTLARYLNEVRNNNNNHNNYKYINGIYGSRKFKLTDYNGDPIEVNIAAKNENNEYNVNILRKNDANEIVENIDLIVYGKLKNKNDIVTIFDDKVKFTSTVVFDKQNNLQIFYNGNQFNQNLFTLNLNVLSAEDTEGFSGNLFAEMPSEVQKINVKPNQ